jgi:LPXTG-motif cell wall-anchored protein
VKRLPRKPLVGLALSAMLMVGAGLAQPAATADVNELQGSAYGAFVKVGLFGGAPSQVGPAPMAELPPTGGTKEESLAKHSAQFGPAVIFGGIWPCDSEPDGVTPLPGGEGNCAASGPASGPLKTKTEGKTGAGGFVTSSVDITKHPTPVEVPCSAGWKPPCTAPGGIGPGPLIAEDVHSECRADESGLTGSVRFSKGIVETHYSKETQLAISHTDIPDNPPPGWSEEGTLDHIGDHYKVVANEQIIEGNVITVRAAHMYLLGPIAVGDSIVGQVTCGLSAAKISTAPPVTVAKARNSPTTLPDSNLSAQEAAAAVASKADDDDDSTTPLVIGGVAVVAFLALGGFLSYKRRKRENVPPGADDTAEAVTSPPPP